MFTDFIRESVQELIPKNLPIAFYWDRFKKFEGKYIVYQTEDLLCNGKLDSNYKSFLDNAEKVYDYSLANIEIYPSIFLPFLPNLNSTKSTKEKEIDILFYGLVTPRRQNLFHHLREKGRTVSAFDGLTIEEMRNKIEVSNQILSYGSSDNRCNDLLRISIALNLGGSILCEPVREEWCNDFLSSKFKERITWIKF
jgi:hypothetical protein